MNVIFVILVAVGAQHALGQTCTTPIWSCDFDANNVCDMVQSTDDDKDWTVNSGPTPSVDIGPTDDISGGGFYIYTEASSVFQGTTYVIKTPDGLDIGCGILTFYVSRYNLILDQAVEFQAELEVIALSNYTDVAGGAVLGTYSMTKDEKWEYIALQCPQGTAAIAFKVTRGDNFRGDIALDDIRICSGGCRDLGECGPGNPDVIQCNRVNVDDECTPSLGWGQFYAHYRCPQEHVKCHVKCINDTHRPADCDGIETRSDCQFGGDTPCDQDCGVGKYTKTYSCTGQKPTICPYLCCCKECSPGMDMFPSLTPCAVFDNGPPICV